MRGNSRSLQFPKVGEPFELSSYNFDPLELVEEEHAPEEWRHAGVVIDEAQIRVFRFIVTPSEACTFQKATDFILASQCFSPEGQWLRAFKHKYPVPPEHRGDLYPGLDPEHRLERVGKLMICVADASWISPEDDTYFPCLEGRGDSWEEGVIGTYSMLDPGILWIVEEV
ncbi:hypothetical protein HY622_02135 [Candidatus Uhrbacteria bacterium]|nr:hypothetical protein [Candidatus Uhrbacteria bacterium]